MAPVILIEITLKLIGIGQVAVMGQGDAVRGVDIKRLGLGRGGTTRRRVTDMADTHITGQIDHVPGAEDIPRQAVVLAHMQLSSIHDDNAGGVLATMLQHQQGVVERLIDRAFTKNSNNTAHNLNLSRDLSVC